MSSPTRRRAAWHRATKVLAPPITVLAGLLVLAALVLPNRLDLLAPGAVLRLPVEALLAVALILVLPIRAGRVVAALGGLALGLLTIVKLVDMGFFAVLARPFDPVLDWSFFPAGMDFLTESYGRSGAVGAAVVIVLLAVALLVLMTLSALRLGRLVVRHDRAATRAVAALGLACVACAALGVRVVPAVPASGLAFGHLAQVRESVLDRRAYAAEVAVDAFRDAPADRLLTALRGKDVVFAFVESYGRDAIEDPALAPPIKAVLADGDRRLGAAGYAARSGFLTSPTTGGGSWLAHATLLSGLWIDNHYRYDKLLASDRLTLNGAFRRAAWQTVGVMPGIIRDWPEGKAFYGYDRLYDSRNVGYNGLRFSFGTIPDQFTLAAFDRTERAAPRRTPVMAEIALVSSHGPWDPVPEVVPWEAIGDGSIYRTMDATDPPASDLRDAARLRGNYQRCIGYSLNTVISYLERQRGDDLVLVVLGDHQPSPMVTGADASWDVPISIVARDRAVLERITDWGWHGGLRPGAGAPVWPMSAFRDRFLNAYGPDAP